MKAILVTIVLGVSQVYAGMVAVFAYGPGAEHFQGIYDNTEIFTVHRSPFTHTLAYHLRI
ncbi:MAG: hypothetical protein U9R60_01950 [Bacteroidota bacterium]|nr:hypothetical protein [Bacteroidota bacterium]